MLTSFIAFAISLFLFHDFSAVKNDSNKKSKRDWMLDIYVALDTPSSYFSKHHPCGIGKNFDSNTAWEGITCNNNQQVTQIDLSVSSDLFFKETSLLNTGRY